MVKIDYPTVYTFTYEIKKEFPLTTKENKQIIYHIAYNILVLFTTSKKYTIKQKVITEISGCDKWTQLVSTGVLKMLLQFIRATL